MHVKPRAGMRVYDPEKGNWLLPEGREVADGDLYWNRILADGDVTVAAAEAAAPLPIGSGRSKRAPAGDAGQTGDDA